MLSESPDATTGVWWWGMRRFGYLAVALALVPGAWASPDASLKDARIALMYGSAGVLIAGGTFEPGPDVEAMKAFPALPNDAQWSPGEWIKEVSPDLLRGLKNQPKPQTTWRIGDRWQIYPGAGAPVTVTIAKTVYLGHGCTAGSDGAIARFVTSAVANRIAGLRATEFLAVPGAGFANVSQEPLIPIDARARVDVAEVLLRRARGVDMGGVRNAWTIGNQSYVLSLGIGYEGFGLDLEEFDPQKGLSTVVISIGAGC